MRNNHEQLRRAPNENLPVLQNPREVRQAVGRSPWKWALGGLAAGVAATVAAGTLTYFTASDIAGRLGTGGTQVLPDWWHNGLVRVGSWFNY